MKRRKSLIMPCIYVLLIVTVLLLLVLSLNYRTSGPTVNDVHYVEEMSASIDGGPWETVTLPHKFQHLKGGTPVTLTARISPDKYDAVYIKTVYSPAKIYLDDQLAYEFGKAEDYPPFMKEPATEIHLVETGSAGKEVTLRMEFSSPLSRDSLTVHPPIVGSSKELIFERQKALGLSLSFSLMQLILGGALILISLFLVFSDRKAVVFLWLGLFSLATGAWSFGENNFAGLVFKQTAFLYLLSFIGFFTFIIPLIRFIRAIVDFENPKPLCYIELFMVLSACVALLLQLTGLIPCFKSMYFFHIVLPLVLIALTILVAAEYVRCKNRDAKRMLIPLGILSLSAILELFNYRFPFTYVFSSVFQVGILIFLLAMGVIAGLSVKDSMNLRAKQKELEFRESLVAIQIKEQHERGKLLAQHEQLLSRQRHDLRHHLMAIQELAGVENEPLQDYLSDLISAIPKAEASFCENKAVNAIVAHHAALCQQNDIAFSAELMVPEETGQVTEGDLCIIFGNLLENAVEACCRMTEGHRFIKIRSSLQHQFLTITVDNSFNGKLKKDGSRFISSKRDDFGIGLESVKAVALKARGSAEFKSKGRVFLSSVYIKL